MPVVTSYKQGTPSFVDLATTDEAGAITFYGALFGWTEEANPMGPDQYYHMFSLNGSVVAGMYKMAPEMGDHPPYWATYITVDNADEAGQRAVAAGGKLVMEPMDVFTFGRMVGIQDPQQAFVNLWQAKDHIGSQIVNEPGSVVWNELLTTDTDAAAGFYQKVLGVEVNKNPMPGMDYTLLQVDGHEVAGVMNITSEMAGAPPHWGVYFAVDDTDAMSRKAESLGAKVEVPPQDIPEVGRFAVLQDPQGAYFNIIKMVQPST
jgi:predicted enzyme related to lactoylglutathione lyase